MKEKIYTIPLMDAFKSGDECPFCFIERQTEQHAISFILGSAYMEDDIRAKTDEQGFCRHHFKMMFDYGNKLGNALMLRSYFEKLNKELPEQLKQLKPAGSSFFGKLRKGEEGNAAAPVVQWLDKRIASCYVCEHIKQSYPRYLDTFFELFKKEPEFVSLVQHSKGFCLPHVRDLLALAPQKLNEKQQQEFYDIIRELMTAEMKRVGEDVAWFVEKNDYRYRDDDWKNSRDAVQRSMQKAAGGHPGDEVFMADR